ncbi:MAG: FliH/SctL family protein [bacterium]
MIRLLQSAELLPEYYQIPLPLAEEHEDNASRGREEEEKPNEAEKIIKIALEKARAIKDEAFSRGYAEGKKAAEEEVVPLVTSLKGIITSFEEEKERFFREAEKEVVSLALHVSKKILHQEPALNPEIVVPMVRAGLERLASGESVEIRVNPEDYALLRISCKDLLEREQDSGNVKIIEDPKVSRGGCVLKTASVEMDMRLESQLDEIGRVIQDIWHE